MGQWLQACVVQVFTEDEIGLENATNGTGKSTRKYAKINWLKAGFLAADKVLTVSPNYAEEIATNESLGVELDDVIRWVFQDSCTHLLEFQPSLHDQVWHALCIAQQFTLPCHMRQSLITP